LLAGAPSAAAAKAPPNPVRVTINFIDATGAGKVARDIMVRETVRGA
jgi:hypothetical protein